MFLPYNLRGQGWIVGCCDFFKIHNRKLPNSNAGWVKLVKKKKRVLGCNSDALGRHRITVATCVASGILMEMSFPKGHFTHIMIDEAGQSMEPQSLIPLVLMDSTSGQAVLAGTNSVITCDLR